MHWRKPTKIISVIAATGMALTVTACGSSSSGNSSNGSSSGQVTVRVGTWDGGSGLAQAQTLAADYMKTHPNVKVEIESSPSDYGTKLQTELAAGNAPDIFQLGDGDIRMYQGKGVLADLTPYMSDSSKGLKLSDYNTSLLDVGKIDGKYYTIGNGTSMCVYVNKDAFAAAGLKLPTSSWTWDELEKDAIALTKRDGSGNVTQWGIRFNGDDLRTYLPFLYDYGGDAVSQDGKQVVGVADSAGSIAGWTEYNKLMNVDKVAPGTKAVGSNNGNDFFLAPSGKKVGLAAMELSGDWGGTGYTKAGMNFTVLPIPAGPAGQFTTMDYAGLAINAKSKNADAAWDYLKYWATDGQMALAATGVLVPYKPALAKYNLDSAPATAEFVKSFSIAKPFPELLNANFSASNAASDLKKVLTDIQATNGSVDVATELKAAAAQAQKDLDGYQAK